MHHCCIVVLFLLLCATLSVNGTAFPPFPIGVFLRLGSDASLPAALSFARQRHNSLADEHRRHAQITVPPFKMDLLYATLHTKPNDAFGIWDTVCDQMKYGFFGMLADGDQSSVYHYDSLAKRMHMPYINWKLPNRLIDLPDYRLSDFSVSVMPPVHQVVADWIAMEQWKTLTILLDGPESGITLELIYEYLRKRASITKWNDVLQSRIVQMPRNEMDFAEFVRHYRTMVLISERPRQRQFLKALRTLSLQSPQRFHYIMADYGYTLDDVEQMKLLYMNFTTFHIVNYASPLYAQLKEFFYRGFVLPVSQDEKYEDFIDEFEITTESALLYDGVQVLLESMQHYNQLTNGGLTHVFHRGRFMNFNQLGIYCVPSQDVTNRQRTFKPFAFGQQLAKAIRKSRLSPVNTLTGPIEFDPNTGIRRNFNVTVHNLVYEYERTYGTDITYQWNSRSGFANGKKETTRENFGLVNHTEDYVVRITTVNTAPFAFLFTDSDGRTYLDGYCIDLTKMLAQIMGFKYEIHLVKDRKYGGVGKNGEWNGMIGELIRQEADMAIAPLTINRKRERVVDFSKPFITTGISIMIKKPDQQDFSVFSFMQPLSMQVWVYIIVAYVAVSFVICLVSRFSPYEWSTEERSDGTLWMHNDFTIYNTLYFTLAAFMQQGTTHFTPISISNRIASSCWWFFTLIMVASYTANLAAFLTSEKLQPAIDSIEGLATQHEIKYGIQGGGSTAAFFATSSVSIYNIMWQFMVSQTPSVFTGSYAEGISRVRDSKGKYAFLLEATANEYENTRTPCNTMKVGDLLNSVGYGVAAPFGSQYRHGINQAVLQLSELGELKKLQNKWWYDRSQCDIAESDSQGVSLNLSKVAGVFYVLLMSMFLSILTAWIEYTYNKSKIQDAEMEDELEEKFNHKHTPVMSTSTSVGSERDEDILILQHPSGTIQEDFAEECIPFTDV